MTSSTGLTSLALGAALVLCAAALPASAQADQLTYLNDQVYGPPGQFHLYDRFQQKDFNFPADRKMRLCVSRPGVGIGEGKAEPMKYRADGRSGVVDPGACKTVMAKHVALSPDGVVPPNWEIDGTVKKVG
jgi:hypothetical protein